MHLTHLANLLKVNSHGHFTKKLAKELRVLAQKSVGANDSAISIQITHMMKFVCLLTKKYEIPTDVSLNTIMVDGTGMCGACLLYTSRCV